MVCDAAHIDQRFGPDAFDVVISTELLEHARAALEGGRGMGAGL